MSLAVASIDDVAREQRVAVREHGEAVAHVSGTREWRSAARMLARRKSLPLARGATHHDQRQQEPEEEEEALLAACGARIRVLFVRWQRVQPASEEEYVAARAARSSADSDDGDAARREALELLFVIHGGQ